VVSPTAPVGTTITVKGYYQPINGSNQESPAATITFLVVSQATPQVQALNGDVHAGGGLCNNTQYAGSVQGNSSANSMADYVVSASNVITNFASNANTPGAGTLLNVGSGGGYSEVCREDLWQAAYNYRYVLGGTGYNLRGAGSYDITGWSGLYYLDAGASIHGTVSPTFPNTLTIVSMAGDVHIDGPITLSTAAIPSTPGSSHSVPSLGVIALHNILIDPGINTVDAYLFADGYIDTCDTANAFCQSPSPLTVTGFLMANDIKLHRLGPHNANGSPTAEQVVLNPQIYLNPPQFFDASVDNILLEGNGERPPLY
jgi:hypothetical protein